jgi:hypothetical protein
VQATIVGSPAVAIPAVNAEIKTGAWKLNHDTSSKSTRIEFKKQVAGSNTLTITQNVPSNKWFLVPSPIVTLKNDGLLGKASEVESSWDFQSRKGGYMAKVYAGKDKCYKAILSGDTAKNTKLGLRAKLDNPIVHSASISGNSAGSIELGVKTM